MQCERCGGLVTWRGPLSALTHTECESCGGINCQVYEPNTEEVAERDAYGEPPCQECGAMTLDVAISASEVAMRDKEIKRLEKELDEEREKRYEGNRLNSIELAESQKNDMYAMKLLAASQAREAKLRECLESLIGWASSPPMKILWATAVLKMPHDDTALKEFKRKVLLDAAD